MEISETKTEFECANFFLLLKQMTLGTNHLHFGSRVNDSKREKHFNSLQNEEERECWSGTPLFYQMEEEEQITLQSNNLRTDWKQ